MNPKEFKKSSSGGCIKLPQGFWAFIPNPLPPEVSYDKKTILLLSEADQQLGELSGIEKRPFLSPFLLIAHSIKREAVFSSRIEGTLATMRDLFYYEADKSYEKKVHDVREVQNYVDAMKYGLIRLKKLPVSNRLIREIHKILMQDVRGGYADPGYFRRSQNWIGSPGSTLQNATYVPPPVQEMEQALGDLEKYIHSNSNEPPLIQCALMHYQFEAIHPFLDGNGRIGRLLTTFFLCEQGHLSQPLLYLSEYFSQYRDEYYARLLAVSKKGDWGGWIRFFLTGICEQSKKALKDINELMDLHITYKEKLEKTPRVPKSSYLLIDEILKTPVVSISELSSKWDIPFNSVKTGVRRLVELDILKQQPGRKRNKMFTAPGILKLLREPSGE